MLRKALVLSSLMACTMAASAAPVSLPQDITTALGSTWNLTNTGDTDGGAFSGSCVGNPGLTIQDAQSANGDSDMYDNAFGIWVDNVAFVAPATVDLTGTTLTAGPVALSGLDTTVQYHFSDVVEAVRSLVTFTNPSAGPITVTVEVANNFGSDSSTTVVGTSSGDTAYTLADSWVTTWDTSSEINTTAFATPGATVMPDSYTQTVFSCAGPEGMGATFTLTVPAGATQSLVFFGGIAEIDGTGDTDTANAMANAMMFESLSTIDSSLTSDLSPAQVAQIVNYVGEPVLIPDVPVPTLSQWALFALMVLMGLVGFGAVRRRA
jgi:hypothetical protein